jgi:radical SAM superfamily enzyme YgiQ (UPF0313 family)
MNATGGDTAVCLVELAGEQGYLPIGAPYLAAHASADEAILRRVRWSFVLEHCQQPVDRLFRAVTRDGVPDVVGLSCQGWSVPHADELARRLRRSRPDVTIVYGGNHVSHQGEAFFAPRPFADVLVNGEGEETFRELLLRHLDDPERPELADVLGLSYRTPDGEVRTNPDRPRIRDLDLIPSPFLTGLLDRHLERCSTALLETNRGCPYHCSFCYWGEATGQKLHRFSLERLRAEMAYLAERRVDSWYVCDANFGILARDEELVDEIVRLRQEHGYPQTVHTNWAKNSNQRIVEMCAKLRKGGVHSTYTLALQSTTELALTHANRANMKINQIDEIARLCRRHGVVPRGELIWGLPGETYDEFLGSYDDLAEFSDALSVYPLYVLPNTEYAARAAEHAIRTERAEPDTDYEYCVEHASMTYETFLDGLRFIVSNNILKVGGVFFRLYPRAAKALGVPFHRTIGGLAEWIPTSDLPVARRFRKYYEAPLRTHRQSLTEVWMAIARDRDALVEMFERYVEETVHAGRPDDEVEILREAFRFDAETYPVVDTREEEDRESVDGSYVRFREFAYDLLSVQRDGAWPPRRGSFTYRIELPAGLWRYPMGNWYFGLLGYQGRVERAATPARALA